MVTARDVARKAGISDSVVSAVLGASSSNVRCSAETRRRVLDVARELGYRRHPASAALRTGRTHIMGLYLGDASWFFRHPHGAYTVACIHETLSQRGYSSMIVSLDGPKPCDLRLVDGLFIVGYKVGGDEEAIRAAAEQVPAFGWVGRSFRMECGVHMPDPSIAQRVMQANHEMAARHLFDAGHRHIALVQPHGSAKLVPALPIFQRIAAERGIRVELVEVFDFLLGRTYPNTMRFVNEGRLPTAFYVLDDEVAQRIIDRLSWRGLSVPKDVSIFSRQTDDGESSEAAGITGILTDWPTCWRGLVDQCLDVIEGKAGVECLGTVTAPTQRIVERSTCAAPRAGALS